MKKLLPLIALTVLLAGCNPNSSSSVASGVESNEPSSVEPTSSESSVSSAATSSVAPTFDRTSLSIITPTGAPALAFYNYAESSNFETNSNPQTGIIPLMVSGQKDVVVLPTNAGVQAIKNKNANYQLAATITFGNFYLVSMGNDTNNQLDAGDKILLFQQGNVPDKVFHYVYGETYDSNVYYVSAVSDAAAAANSGSFVDATSGERIVPNYVMLAEPVLTTVLSKKENVTIYADMQAKYAEKSNNLPLFQASVFIKKTVERSKAEAFLASLKADIESAIATPTLMSAGMNKVAEPQVLFGVAPQMAENVLKKNNGMGLGFKNAKENKAAVNNFLQLFGIEGLNEEAYF